MNNYFIPLLSYVLISTFTPGPSNISSASLSVLHGYKKTLRYQAGLAVGVLSIMFVSGWISTTLLRIFPALEPVLRFAGAAYILYLAFGILRATYSFSEEAVKPLGFVAGLALNLLNPKLIVYAFTLFSTFLASITDNLPLLALAASLLAAISFASTSTWAVFGGAIKTYLRNPRLKTVVNILLALSLVYAAIVLTGLI
ncbi:MAG: LysE family transporter [Anaerolineaceae bacterium]|nr:LysE family transporter [Anaerolineaceae bacterium]